MKSLMVAILLVSSFFSFAQYSRDQAIDILLEEVVGIDSLEIHHLFSRFEKGFYGDTIWFDDYFDFNVCPFTENWLFFVDDAPLAFWAHPCRWIFFDVNTGAYEIIHEILPPAPYLLDVDDFMLEWDWILSTYLNPEYNENFVENLKIRSNPFQNKLEIIFQSLNDKSYCLMLYNLNGQKVIHKNINHQKTGKLNMEINIDNLKAGIYILVILNNDSVLGRYKVLKANQ